MSAKKSPIKKLTLWRTTNPITEYWAMEIFRDDASHERRVGVTNEQVAGILSAARAETNEVFARTYREDPMRATREKGRQVRDTLDAAVLGEVTEHHPASAWQVASALGHISPSRQGMVHRALDRLEAKGLISRRGFTSPKLWEPASAKPRTRGRT